MNIAHYGTDLDSRFEVVRPDIFTNEEGKRVLELDFKLVSGVDNAKQAIRNRLITHFREFELFQYYKYYNLAYDYLLCTNIPIAKIGIKLATIECLDNEPFVETVNDVVVEETNDIRAFEVKINITVIGDETFDIRYILRNDMSIDWLNESEDELYESEE